MPLGLSATRKRVSETPEDLDGREYPLMRRFPGNPLQAVWVGAFVGEAIAMLLRIPPGVVFWALVGTAQIVGTLAVMLVAELLNKPPR